MPPWCGDTESAIPGTVDEEGRDGEPKEYPVGEGDVVDQLAEAARERERRGPDRLEPDGGGGRAMHRVESRQRHRTAPRRVVMAPALAVRGTTAPPSKK